MLGKVLTTGLTNRRRSHTCPLPTVLSCVCTLFPNDVGSSFLPVSRCVEELEAWVKHVKTGFLWQWESCILLSLNLFSFFLVGSISRCPNICSCLSSCFWYSNYFWPFNARQLQFIFHLTHCLHSIPSSIRLLSVTFEIFVSTEPSPTSPPTLLLSEENRSLEVISNYISS